MSFFKRVIKAAFKEAVKPSSFVKGEEFENYARDVIFTQDKFELDHKSHDYSNNKGDYITTSLAPDFIFTSKKSKKQFCVEIKYRSKYFNNAIEYCKKHQFKRYKDYDKKKPVFILLGVGGLPYDPDELFLFPIRKVKYTKLFESVLKEYKIHTNSPYPENLLWKNLK